MNFKTAGLSVFIFLLSPQITPAQCSHNPTITGNTILCPGDSSILSTQSYDSYQWYKREWLSGNPFTPVTGGTQQTLTVYENTDLLYEFVVEATLAGCTEASDTALIDGHTFLLPYASENSTPGTTQYNPNTDVIEVCNGYTVLIEGNDPPYTTYTWYLNGTVIPGITGNQYTVAADGSYTFDACTGICPDFCQSLGVTLTFEFGDWSFCPANNMEEIKKITGINAYPNPAQDVFYLQFPENGKAVITFTDLTGKVIKKLTSHSSGQLINISDLPEGMYIINAAINGRNYLTRLNKAASTD